MRKFLSIDPATVEEVVGQSGWDLGPQENYLVSPHGVIVRYEEAEDGHLYLFVEEGTDLADIFERVPFDEVEDADR
jgi:hypothetical protein